MEAEQNSTDLKRETRHRVILDDSGDMTDLGDGSIDLVVTSPPYPMISMWDESLAAQDPHIEQALSVGDADTAFERMHALLDGVWSELRRVVAPGGMVCINIGDAVRTFDGHFRLFANHVRISAALHSLGFTQLPAILWRKPTNAPNKFMGSGMLPPGAYVTLEHEYILLFRQPGKRTFATAEEKRIRRESAYFWEERNEWFSDVWFNLAGAAQAIQNGAARKRSAAFPLEIPYRLINMFSVKNDTVLDPFLGTGTTMLAAMAAARHSIGFERDPSFLDIILQKSIDLPQIANQMIGRRLKAHADFIQTRLRSGGRAANHNRCYDVPVVTRQEEDLFLDPVQTVQSIGNDRLKVVYAKPAAGQAGLQTPQDKVRIKAVSRGRQLRLF